MIATRQTKYTTSVYDIITSLNHPSNLQITNYLRRDYPKVSQTTVHRITQRLMDRGLIKQAPHDNLGSMRFDSNLSDHDHFICKKCNGIRDINLPDKFIKQIEKDLGDCKVNGNLIIEGNCHKCVNKRSKK